MSEEEIDFDVIYAAVAISFYCIGCGATLKITKHSLHSVMSGIFCHCGEHYYVHWDDGTLKRRVNEVYTVTAKWRF